MDDGLLEIDFVFLTSDSLTTNASLKSLHVAFLQYINCVKLFCCRNVGDVVIHGCAI